MKDTKVKKNKSKGKTPSKFRTFISKKLYRDTSMHAIAKRGDLIVYTTGVAFRHSTLLELYSYLKSVIEPCK